jgi:hypothetical protein
MFSILHPFPSPPYHTPSYRGFSAQPIWRFHVNDDDLALGREIKEQEQNEEEEED